jgi:hypothetical protein
MSPIDRFLAQDRWAMSRAEDLPDRTARRWLPVLPVLIPLLIGTVAAAVLRSSAVWLGALIGVALAASLILNARESG